MRITEEAKKANRDKILKAARRLFTQKGFEDATIREIAKNAGLAVGTMFNYFPSKETMAMSMVNEALHLGIKDFYERRAGGEELNEELFLFIASGLRRLRPMHSFVGPILAKSLSPFPGKTSCEEGELTRQNHLDTVRSVVAAHGYTDIPEAVATHIYWSLYLGILAFWAHDESTNQEATTAMIDYSLTLFTRMLSTCEPDVPGMARPGEK